MPKNILIDINILLDIVQERPRYQSSRQLLDKTLTSKYNAYVSGHAVTTLAYLLERAGVPRTLVLKYLHWLLGTFRITATDRSVLKSATTSRIKDYEDAVIEQAALNCGAESIITRNVKDFRASRVPAITPEQWLKV